MQVVIDNQRFVVKEDPIDERGEGHEIATVADMLRVVKIESLEKFLIDLRHVFLQYYALEEMQPYLTKFTWIDDGQYHVNTNLHVVGGTVEEKEELIEELQNRYDIYEKC